MANWNKENSVITSSGISLLAKAQIGEGTIEITRIVSRDTVSTADENINYTSEDIKASSIKQTGSLISSTTTEDGVSIITVRFSNERLSETYTYTLRQVIAMAKLVAPNGIDATPEVPYFVLQSNEGDILPPRKDTPTSYDYKVHIVHTGTPNIIVNVSPTGFASEEEFYAFKTETDSKFLNNGQALEKIVAGAVGQQTENLTFVPWMPKFDESDRAWSKIKSNLERNPVGKANSERFNFRVDVLSEDKTVSSGNMSVGSYSHAEGLDNIAFGLNSHAEGSNNYIGFALDDTKGNYQHCASNSHAEGLNNIAVCEDQQHIEGYNNFSNGFSSHTEGAYNINKGEACHVEGNFNEVSGDKSKFNSVTGDHNKCINSQKSHVSGGQNSVDESYNVSVSGLSNMLTGVRSSYVTGEDNVISDTDHALITGNHQSTSEVSYTAVSGSQNTITNGNHVFAQGMGLKSTDGNNCSLFGKYNVDDTENRYAMIVGNGTSPTSRRNIFTLDNRGNLYTAGAVNSQSADLAEFFEWADQNKDHQDRTGLFVTLNEDKIELASYSNDYVLGCVSACPAIVANNPQEWHSKYKTDVFGRVLYEENKTEVTEEDGTTTYKVTVTPVLNPDFKEENYVPRSSRPEWACVACTGRVVVVDDGSCEPNGYCRPHKKGIATKSDTGFRVLKRIDSSHILVWIEHSMKF